MYFESLNAALSMAGHGIYVWSAYAICLRVLCLLLVLPGRKRRFLIRDIHSEQRRRAAAAARADSADSDLQSDLVNRGES
ncbi:MAG: hypothetical protein Cons2KO_20990 [Congregibacter sp.]